MTHRRENWNSRKQLSVRRRMNLKNRNMTQVEFAKQVGIATSTISEWKKKKTNPTADKIMDICNVLQITPEQLLTGKGIEDEEEIVAASPESRFTPYDIQLIEDYHGLKEEQKKRLMAYVEALKKIESRWKRKHIWLLMMI